MNAVPAGRRWQERPVPLEIFIGMIRDRTNLFQSFLQPILLLVILAASLGSQFGTAPSPEQTLRGFYLSFSAAEFYAVSILLVTVLIASQYGTDLAVQFRRQHRSPVMGNLSIIAGIVLLVSVSVVFFLAASRILLGMRWPWTSPAFWGLLGGLVLASTMGGCTIGLATADRGWSDLLVSVLVFGSVLAAGAFFPFPESSRIWNLARWNPVTHILSRMLELLRTSVPPPGNLDRFLWAIAAGATGIVVWQLWRLPREAGAGTGSTSAVWASRQQQLFLCGLAIVALPPAIWLAGPADFLPEGLMFPYSGIATVLLLVFNALLVSPVADGPATICRRTSFRRSFLWTRGALGIAVVLLSVFAAALVWKPQLSDLLHTAGVLAIFHLWSLAFMLAIAGITSDRTVYWALAVASLLLITFLGGSLWRPSLLGATGSVISMVLPNGLLLYLRSPVGPLVVVLQIGALLVLSSPRLRQWFRPARRIVVGDCGHPHPPTGSGRDSMLEVLMIRERKRILDDVHDSLGHGITGALWQIRSARGMTADPAITETLDRAAHGLEQGLLRVRNYLRDSAPRQTTDWSSLHAAVQQFSHCPVELLVNGDAAAFHPVAVKVFTLTLQELLTNALRYGDPVSISITLIRTARFHRLEYRERGRGWGQEGPRMGYGLSTVRSLFTEIGGSFHLDHLPDEPGIQVTGMVSHMESAGEK